MYADGKTVRAILAATGFSLDQLYTQWRLVAAADRAAAHHCTQDKPRGDARRYGRAPDARAAELQIHGLEQQLEKAGYVPAESERNSRVTAALARTMRELAAKDERDTSRKAPNKSGGSNDDIVPLDIDELRRSLTRKLDALVAEQQGTLHRVVDGE